MKNENPISRLVLVTIVCGLIEVACIVGGIFFQRYYIREYKSAEKTYSMGIQSTEHILTYLYTYENAILLKDCEGQKNALQIIQSELADIQSLNILQTEQEKEICKNALLNAKNLKSDSTDYKQILDSTRSDIGLFLSFLKEDKQAVQQSVEKINIYSVGFDVLAIFGTFFSVAMCIYLVGKNSKQIFEAKELEGYTDGLTHIYNRKFVDEQLSKKINTGAIGYLYMFDMDNFKKVNDTYGHEEGDRVLKDFATILNSTLRSTDYPCRLGGDEYMVFANAGDDTNAEKLAERIIDATLAHFENGNGNIITLSCGIAKVSGTKDFDTVYKEADNALYWIKNNGKNGYLLSGKDV